MDFSVFNMNEDSKVDISLGKSDYSPSDIPKRVIWKDNSLIFKYSMEESHLKEYEDKELFDIKYSDQTGRIYLIELKDNYKAIDIKNKISQIASNFNNIRLCDNMLVGVKVLAALKSFKKPEVSS